MAPAKTRPSVLLINRIYPPDTGASGRVLRDLAKGFAKSGWQVTVLTTGPATEKQKDGSILIYRIKAKDPGQSGRGYLWVWLRLFMAAWSMPKRNLMITMTDPPLLAVAGQIVASFKKMPHIHWCQDLYPDLLPAIDVNVSGGVMRLLKRISGWAMKKCDHVVVIGRCMADHIAEYGLDPAKVSIIPNWPDLEISRTERDQPKTPFLDSMERKKPLRMDERPKFRILYAGNIGRAHPMEAILQAAERLSDHPEIEFVFVGSNKGHDYLAAQRDSRGLQNIRLLPYQPFGKLREVLESGDVHIVSMRQQAHGLMVPSKFYSALAVGRPCVFIGPENSEIGKVINDFRAGEVVNDNNGDVLADVILRYRMNSDEWFEAQGGAAEAGDVFFPKQSIREWIKCAHNVVAIRKSA